MPKKPKYPKPTKRFLYGAWVILWRYSPFPGEYRQYTVSTGLGSEKKDEPAADIILHRFAVALAEEWPEFPPEYADTSGVRRYMADRFATPTLGDWLKDYEPVITQEVKPSWSKPSLAILKRLAEFAGGLDKVTPDLAQRFLVELRKNQGSIAWRNRVLSMCSRFFKWAVATKRMRESPFAGIKILKEPREGEIVFCTRDERDRIIAMAKATGWPDWIAVPVAFYTGMRKEEVALMRWEHVLFAEGRVVVPVTKTKERRVFPLSAQLRELLEATSEEKRLGYVVPMDAGLDRVFRLENLHRKIRKLNSGVGRWKKDRTQNKPDAEKEREPIPEERIGWNAFRHTFGSLLAQAGVGLDKISSWMGNTPEVCRRHYAHFVPRDRHDEDIDKL